MQPNTQPNTQPNAQANAQPSTLADMLANIPRSVDVAVVGSGLAGLAAARTAAARGCSVAVFEAGPVGGRARSHDRSGFRFNLGPRALYLGGPGQGVLDRLSVKRTGGAPFLSQAALLVEQGLVTAPTSAKGFASSPALSTAGKAQFGLFMGKIGLMRTNELGSVSTADWLAAQNLRADVHAVVRGICRLGTYCDDLDALSADAAVASMKASSRGVQYADGGWQGLVDQLVAGVAVHRAKVERIAGDDDWAELLLVGGEKVRARTVVVAVNSPGAASAVLERDLPPHGPASMARCLTIGMAGAATPPVVVGVSDALYLSMHCPPAQLHVGDRTNGSVVHVMRYLGRNDRSVDPATAKAELFALAERCGIAAESVIESEYLHSMVVVSAIATPELGGLSGRIKADASGLASVVLAGDYVGPLGQLADCSLVSGESAGQAAAARLRRLGPVTGGASVGA